MELSYQAYFKLKSDSSWKLLEYQWLEFNPLTHSFTGKADFSLVNKTVEIKLIINNGYCQIED